MDKQKRLLQATMDAESWLVEFGADDSPDEGLRHLVRDLRAALSEFGIVRFAGRRCEVQGCNGPAEYEGWWRALDPFLGTPTGLIQRRTVCEKHKSLLIGGKDEAAQR